MSIIRPLLTEKSAHNIDKGLYVFTLDARANKKTVAAELKAVYDVTPLSVRIVNLPAKQVNFKRRQGMQSVRRKAYVQLPPKTTIPGFEVLKEKEVKADKKAEVKEKA